MTKLEDRIDALDEILYVLNARINKSIKSDKSRLIKQLEKIKGSVELDDFISDKDTVELVFLIGDYNSDLRASITLHNALLEADVLEEWRKRKKLEEEIMEEE